MLDGLRLTPRVYIFGAQSRAKTLKGYLQFLYPEVVIISFLVDGLGENETTVDGIPVQTLDSVENMDTVCDVLVATKGIYHDKIRERLEEKGMRRIMPVTVDIDNFLRNAYVKRCYEEKNMDFTKIADLTVRYFHVAVYMAESVYDKPLKSVYISPDYEKEIQVGASLTTKRLSPDILTDCEGENISAKNRQYCELTALYWIWKNAKEDIIGLTHYRRHFILPDRWQEIMYTNDIDVILPVPTFVCPNIGENYKERHDPADWEYLMRYLEENNPEDYVEAVRVFAGNLYLPCNMFIMRKEILNDLCSWMFPILDAVVEHGGIKEDTYMNRYPGFISERLMTLYFYRRNQKYHIVYADKSFIS